MSVRARPATSCGKSAAHVRISITLAELQTEKDSIAEGSEFKLPVPVSKLSDDSIMLEFATRQTSCRDRAETPMSRMAR